MDDEPKQRRLGGRGARVADAVLNAAAELIAERGNDHFSITELAERSGVHHASIYRRWGTAEDVVLALAAARLDADSPVPDSGSLRGDLLAYARGAARSVAGPDGLAFLRAVIAAGGAEGAQPGPDVVARGEEIQTMLDRAAERGEEALHFTDVLDGVLAPVYFRRLFGIGHVDDVYLQRLVDGVIANARRAL